MNNSEEYTIVEKVHKIIKGPLIALLENSFMIISFLLVVNTYFYFKIVINNQSYFRGFLYE